MDEQALLRAIIDDPDDDTVRLVYADWLDEHDEADRAAFVRVQIELARLAADDPRRPALAAREEALFGGPRLLQLRQQAPTAISPYLWSLACHRRGFLTRVELSAALEPDAVPDSRRYGRAQDVNHFLLAAPALFAHAPITELQLSASWELDWNSQQVWGYHLNSEMVRDLAPVSELTRLRSVEVVGPAFDLDAVCQEVIANPYLRNLRRLHIQNRYPLLSGISGEAIDPLAPATQADLRAAFGDRVTWDE